MDSVSVCNFSSKCEAGASIGLSSVNNVELVDVSMEESMVCDGIVGGNEFPEISALPNADEINVAISERDSKLSGSGEVQTVTVKNPANQSDDVSLSHEPSSLTDIEISGDGINLFVEVFGPLDGTSESNSNNDGEQQCTFEVGDLVWVKTRTPLWWPGMIHNPSDGPNNKMKPEKKGSFLVKFYGNTNIIRCSKSNLKPFVEYYEHLSGQNTSRSFNVAVEKALYEIGHRVKLKMTCPCFLKDKNKNSEENLNGKGKTDQHVLSFSRFEPLMFLTRVKELAADIYPLSKIELTVLKNCLSCFYRSAGHLELPLQVLLEAKYRGCNSNDNNNIPGGCVRSVRAKKKKNLSDYDDLASPNKIASESREKKKSKFLSYPFTDADNSNNKEEIGKNSKKKWLTKSLKDHHVISKADDINAPSYKLLTELRSIACNYFYVSKYSDSLRIFYLSFRSYAYLDADIAAVEIKRKKERIRKAKESENPNSNLDSNKGSAGNNVKGSAGNNGVGKKISKKGKSLAKESIMMKKEDQSLFSMGTNVYHNSSCMISFFQARGETNPGPPHGDPTSRLQDLNENNPIAAGRIPVGGPSKNEELVCPSINGADHLGFANVPSSKDATRNIPQFFNLGIINDAEGELMTHEAAPTTTAIINTGLASFGQHALPPHPQMDFFPKTADPKKRKRDEKGFQFADFSIIPDLNGNAPDVMSPDFMSQSGKLTFSDGPEAKKKAANREEDPGGSITLNFAPGFDLPSKEMLVSKFSRYGLVKGSEIKALNECTVHIPYERTPDVKFAYRSLERGHPFGESLVSFDLHCQEEKKTEKKTRKQHPVAVVPVDAFKNQDRLVERPPDIAFMKQRVEAMRSALEKMGNKVSPEVRVKLENEIRAFLEKIGSMTGGSSSSS